ncbi:hypothetical protein SEA_MAYA_45 [Streptomyces phage Maya]|uniref:Uncharacterized protein n=5 Tax=Rimavirus rima TaxID=2560784 RepID=A0A5J6D8C7_9CAUD|nr:hypothetical protein FDH06_gp46 [Streptomyces phage Rima]QAY16344.1 hypothetical protein SEA_NAMO_46 [Streptomyces phage Namo]QEQ93738.1 hypothetical protein SEA_JAYLOCIRAPTOR_45 [Streptomyces phage Jaylociraptor]QEQ93991.1 hypothetical protein SEA_MEIBYSRARUS_43 [Streptomyces phage Meibysrarus]QNN98210.1 hypothetical protein SEA_MAYA_45 [Streptomyces phage Maya]AOZ64998.1 hypothetical protein SEA_RIMA_46 [Streptomyces phage Rima]
MFGEVMGKTKNQLRREVLVMRLRQLKRHIPAIAGAVGTIAATAIAVHYKHEAEKLESFNVDNEWTDIPVPQHLMDALEDGHTLHYRQVRIDDETCYSQYSSSAKGIGFTPELDERFEEAKKERDNA